MSTTVIKKHTHQKKTTKEFFLKVTFFWTDSGCYSDSDCYYHHCYNGQTHHCDNGGCHCRGIVYLNTKTCNKMFNNFETIIYQTYIIYNLCQ